MMQPNVPFYIFQMVFAYCSCIIIDQIGTKPVKIIIDCYLDIVSSKQYTLVGEAESVPPLYIGKPLSR